MFGVTRYELLYRQWVVGPSPSTIFVIRALTQQLAYGKLKRSGRGFASSKGKNRKGYGWQSIESIAKRYAGEAGFSFEETTGVFTSTVLLMSVKLH